MRRTICFASLFVLAMTPACSKRGSNNADNPAQLQAAIDSIQAGALLNAIKALSSDEFEGRAPGTRGEELTIQYLMNEFKSLGLQPGNPDGTYLQKVPLMGFKAEPVASFKSPQKQLSLTFPKDYVAVSYQVEPSVAVRDSEIVFVGYGVVAPEYGWDDYKGVDLRGKTLLMLINDPPIADPADPSKLDENMFKGKAMTYYGRWTYKYEIAAEKGAAAAILVHETGPAGYPYEVVVGSWGRENFDISKAGRSDNSLKVESWITQDVAKRLCALARTDFDVLKRSAIDKAFKPVALGVSADFNIRNTTREIQSNNVIARLEGSDPKLKDQYLIYSAHWDHLGKDETLKGDQIYNGAIDNASGTAALLELAKAYTKLRNPPKRSILFLSVTGEEKGLLGAKYYAENPLYPLAKTVADINIDGLCPWGRTRDIVDVGLGTSTLDDILKDIARSQNRIVRPDPEPEKGFFYRSDHFEFAKQGVPALYTDTGTEFIGKPPDFGARKRSEFTNQDYHKVTDEVRPDWDMSGIVQDVQLLLKVGFKVTENDGIPEWRPGTEFKAKREEVLKKAATNP